MWSKRTRSFNVARRSASGRSLKSSGRSSRLHRKSGLNVMDLPRCWWGSGWLVQLACIIENATFDGFHAQGARVKRNVLQHLFVAGFFNRVEHALSEKEV